MDIFWVGLFAMIVVAVWITVSRFHRGGWYRWRLDDDNFRPSSRTLCVPKPRWVVRELIRLSPDTQSDLVLDTFGGIKVIRSGG
jgi:hypothetical protein